MEIINKSKNDIAKRLKWKFRDFIHEDYKSSEIVNHKNIWLFLVRDDRLNYAVMMGLEVEDEKTKAKDIKYPS